MNSKLKISTNSCSWTHVPNIPNYDRAEKYITEASLLGSSVGANPRGTCPKCNTEFQMTNDNYNKNNENWKKRCSECSVLLVVFND
jgi:predicted  nucleic acid-binding Zn ribbon protein